MRMRRVMGRSILWLPGLAVWIPLCLASTSPLGRPPIPSPMEGFRHANLNNMAATDCAASHPAQALATPDPLLGSLGDPEKVSVSFVIGIDGRVHSPVILESAGTDEDSRVLHALRLWRYRPATCNSAPMEMESKIEFSTP